MEFLFDVSYFYIDHILHIIGIAYLAIVVDMLPIVMNITLNQIEVKFDCEFTTHKSHNTISNMPQHHYFWIKFFNFVVN